MNIEFRDAGANDCEVIGLLVMQLTKEISERTSSRHFDIDIDNTIGLCRALLLAGQYKAILAYAKERPIAVATLAETFALYAGGKIGVVQEFYVDPDFRSKGVGRRLIDEIRDLGRKHGCSCIELTSPPLPEFERTLGFYERNGLAPVGGRKMRQYLETLG
ncbi:GNAT family N-acetyltransferase [Thiohalomonas denitrificans]|uniref:Acetyltransferase (GNAT) family protein n=1 Tax=Thiohalomonas denitrificans TaxID=415747 RepID=A0A1G5PS48_9GAMM|nr:GNAT family N-acetyltransferase [Thiohalomonas denitrificans]SCZ52293.1 Acetyltransferase (GNAT) family protein [Thiohalomonas denitrificans]